MWIHIAGAARGSFNERFATPSPAMFTADAVSVRRRRAGRCRWHARRHAVALSPGSAAEDLLHEHASRVLGRRPGRGAHAHDGRRQTGPRRCPTTSGCICWPARSTSSRRFRPFGRRPRRAGDRNPARAKRRAAVEQSDAAEQRHAGAAPSVARVGRRRHSATAEPIPAPQRRDAGHRSTRVTFPALHRCRRPAADCRDRRA